MFEKISRLAIASLIVSLCFFIPLLSAIAAIILGIIALCTIVKYSPSLRGRGFAITGIVLGVGQLVFIAILSIMLASTMFLVYKSSNSYYSFLGSIYRNMGQNSKAAAYYKKAIEKMHKETKGGYSESDLGKNLSSSFTLPLEQFFLFHNMAAVLQLSGNYNEALQAYSRALETAYKEEAVAHYGIGSINMTQKKFDDALKEFDIAIGLNPSMYDALQNKAVTFRLMGRFNDSVVACQETLRLFPKAAKTYSSMGWAYELMGNFEEAIKAQIEAIRLTPNWQFPKDRTVFCYSNLQNKEKASEFLRELDKIDPSLAQVLRKK